MSDVERMRRARDKLRAEVEGLDVRVDQLSHALGTADDLRKHHRETLRQVASLAARWRDGAELSERGAQSSLTTFRACADALGQVLREREGWVME